jgi:hypothetical protein
MTIMRVTETDYAVVTDTVLADGSMRADWCMRLDGHALRSVERRGDVRTGGRLRVVLGPTALQRVRLLDVGQSVVLHPTDA